MVLHVKFEFHFNRDTLTYLTAKNKSKSFICIHGLKNHIEASDLVHTLILWVSCSLLIFVMVGQKHLKGGVTRAPSQRKVFRTFLYMLWDISLKLHIHLVGMVSHVEFEFHSNLDTLTYLTAKSRSKSFICIHGFKSYIEASDLIHSNSECLDPCWLLSCLGKNTRKGELVELPASDTWGLSFIRIRSLPLKSFLDFFLNVVPYQL